MTRSREPFALSVVVHAAAKGALLCSETGELDAAGKPKDAVWIPRSEITLTPEMEVKLARYDDTSHRERGTMVLAMTIPEWLAFDRGLM